MKSAARWFAVVVALQAALLLGWAGYHEWNRQTARTILLETAPVDPRDILRGDYMILSYKIGRVPAPAGETDDKVSLSGQVGREIWVSLRKNGRFHEVSSTSWARPDTNDAEIVVVRGRAMNDGAKTINVDYGIGKFFVPEGKGRPQFKEMVVEATVSADYELGIKRLLLDGKAYP